MCLVLIAYGVHPEWPLIVAGNRDEFHARPTQVAKWWPDKPDILGGRDLQAGGTWLALHRRGRFATVTNYQGAKKADAALESRGHLVTNFLECDLSPRHYLDTIDGSAYAGFNLLVSDGERLAYSSNRGIEARELEPGIYGLSNATLDTPWTKVERSKASLKDLLDNGTVNETGLLSILSDRKKGPAKEVASGRLPFATAYALTATFVVLPDYGTRCSSTVLVDDSGHWRFLERRFDATGETRGEVQFSFQAQA